MLISFFLTSSQGIIAGKIGRDKPSVLKRLSPKLGKRAARPKSSPFESIRHSDEVSLPEIVLSSQSDISAPRDKDKSRTLTSQLSSSLPNADDNANLLNSDIPRRSRSSSTSSLVGQALAKQGVPQDENLLQTVENELSDSLNISKDQLEGAARNIICDSDEHYRTTLGMEGAPDHRNEHPGRFYNRPDRTSYL